jgi:hypothetical protein
MKKGGLSALQFTTVVARCTMHYRLTPPLAEQCTQVASFTRTCNISSDRLLIFIRWYREEGAREEQLKQGRNWVLLHLFQGSI